MRRMLFISFTGVLVGGCSQADMMGPQVEPLALASAAVSASRTLASSQVNPTGALDDAIDRLLPALGPAGVALGATLRQIRDGGRLETPLIDAAQRQLTSLTRNLAPESAADADALELTLDALRTLAST